MNNIKDIKLLKKIYTEVNSNNSILNSISDINGDMQTDIADIKSDITLIESNTSTHTSQLSSISSYTQGSYNNSGEINTKMDNINEATRRIDNDYTNFEWELYQGASITRNLAVDMGVTYWCCTQNTSGNTAYITEIHMNLNFTSGQTIYHYGFWTESTAAAFQWKIADNAQLTTNASAIINKKGGVVFQEGYLLNQLTFNQWEVNKHTIGSKDYYLCVYQPEKPIAVSNNKYIGFINTSGTDLTGDAGNGSLMLGISLKGFY